MPPADGFSRNFSTKRDTLACCGLGNAAKAEKKSAEIATVNTFWSIAWSLLEKLFGIRNFARYERAPALRLPTRAQGAAARDIGEQARFALPCGLVQLLLVLHRHRL